MKKAILVLALISAATPALAELRWFGLEVFRIITKTDDQGQTYYWVGGMTEVGNAFSSHFVTYLLQCPATRDGIPLRTGRSRYRVAILADPDKGGRYLIFGDVRWSENDSAYLCVLVAESST